VVSQVVQSIASDSMSDDGMPYWLTMFLGLSLHV